MKVAYGWYGLISLQFTKIEILDIVCTTRRLFRYAFGNIVGY